EFPRQPPWLHARHRLDRVQHVHTDLDQVGNQQANVPAGVVKDADVRRFLADEFVQPGAIRFEQAVETGGGNERPGAATVIIARLDHVKEFTAGVQVKPVKVHL